mmetsp:Transcript_12091/g.30488  ORF Transcript_12091/g.30488 Transcript_12091/m.30488 type:complete len:335 (+) Transcript_12091:67-1071(+)
MRPLRARARCMSMCGRRRRAVARRRRAAAAPPRARLRTRGRRGVGRVRRATHTQLQKRTARSQSHWVSHHGPLRYQLVSRTATTTQITVGRPHRRVPDLSLPPPLAHSALHRLWGPWTCLAVCARSATPRSRALPRPPSRLACTTNPSVPLYHPDHALKPTPTRHSPCRAHDAQITHTASPLRRQLTRGRCGAAAAPATGRGRGTGGRLRTGACRRRGPAPSRGNGGQRRAPRPRCRARPPRRRQRRRPRAPPPTCTSSIPPSSRRQRYGQTSRGSGPAREARSLRASARSAAARRRARQSRRRGRSGDGAPYRVRRNRAAAASSCLPGKSSAR